MKNKNVNLSRFLSLVLRHKPQVIGIKLDKNGWCSVEELLVKMNAYGKNITIEELNKIVASDNKQRYAFCEDKKRIRANQGHSLYVELDLKECVPPSILYHGTVERFIDNIITKGLLKMSRQHVHLSEDIKTAEKVGNRRGKAIILHIEAGRMHGDGFKFYLSENGVWLTDCVPREYIVLEK
ncbi:RNA 2'-phosphotransferase [Oceanirhabdus seepicola]|uniref:Probable RNA 2'-phosphotransferase n=1 Tax=Oceanirhabdus seepicola TaxID=2828781 RepID=A0A9J6P2J8_9CLOT|nr:RNA 2'-phosphotransferase [Oceanirhabdus seepicola]MCM1990994.1 RNA 2'-phosphotransferase [Oceanirhabdus seepicola]